MEKFTPDPSHPSPQWLAEQISTLPATDKFMLHTQIVQQLAQQLDEPWPGIEKTLGIVGGDARIVRSRIPVWSLEVCRRLGWNDDQILENFPTLQIWDLQNAWAYVSTNQEEIERTIRENEEA